MIDEKKLIEKTEHYIKRYLEPPYGREIEGTVELLKEVKDVLSEQPKAGAWIPCSERLPEVPEDTDDKDCPEFNVMIEGASVATTLKYSPDGAWFDDLGQVYEVIAWMPLPELWKGDSK